MKYTFSDLEPIKVSFKRNKSYWNSVKIGMLIVFWWLPTTFIAAVGVPLFHSIRWFFGAFISLFLWFFSRTVILFMALIGMVTKVEDVEHNFDDFNDIKPA
jgi:hypothetical protein